MKFNNYCKLKKYSLYHNQRNYIFIASDCQTNFGFIKISLASS